MNVEKLTLRGLNIPSMAFHRLASNSDDRPSTEGKPLLNRSSSYLVNNSKKANQCCVRYELLIIGDLLNSP